jgi:Polyketide cyclase / dehydrase and lipid transport
MPRVTETLIAYDQARRTLTYQAQDLPALVTLARNTWTVVPAGEHRCRVALRAQFQARGALGVLAGWVVAAQTRRNARLLEADLGHYVRHGTPSPRKQRQLRRAARRRPAGP